VKRALNHQGQRHVPAPPDARRAGAGPAVAQDRRNVRRGGLHGCHIERLAVRGAEATHAREYRQGRPQLATRPGAGISLDASIVSRFCQSQIGGSHAKAILPEIEKRLGAYKVVKVAAIEHV